MRCKATVDFRGNISGISGKELSAWLKSNSYPHGTWGNNPLVLFIGKTGYGKSTIINSLLGKPVFETDDICSCTKEPDYALLVTERVTRRCTSNNVGIVLCDMPGIGENEEVDGKYVKMLYGLLGKVSCLVYVLRADQRDFRCDVQLWKDINSNYQEVFKKTIFVMNFADKIEPINRDFSLSDMQKRNLAIKKTEFCKVMKQMGPLKKNDILHIVASDNLNIKQLLSAIIYHVL